MTTSIPTGPIDYLVNTMVSLDRYRHSELSRFETLTLREKEVLTLVAQGISNPAIAIQLNISRSTVQNHRASIRRKLTIATEADYVRYALAYDLIQF